MEIVTEPDLRSPGEAAAFMRELKGILEYAEISDCRMEQGSIRCDANISIRPYGSEEYGTKVEIKNINSFREVQKALEKEEKRQKELYQFGEEYKIKQETRRWDASKAKTLPMRSKEEAHDYRYFPEPDLTPIIIPQEKVDELEKSLPEMPIEKRARFVSEYGLSEKDASIIISSKTLAKFYEEVVGLGGNPKTVSNYILGDLLRMLNANNMEPEDIKISSKNFVSLLKIIESGKISNTAGKEVFKEMFETDFEDAFSDENGHMDNIYANDDNEINDSGFDIMGENGDELELNEEAQQKHFIVEKVLAKLDDRERLIIEKYFGIENDDNGQKLEEISKDLHITTERVRQLKVKAINEMRAEVFNLKEAEFLF